MIQANSISTEATAATNSISQGKHKGSKTSKTLFSSLLDMLQKGSPQGSGKKTAHGQLKQANKDNPDLSTQDIKSKLQKLATKQANASNTLPQIGNKQTGNTQAVDKSLQHILQQVKSTQSIDKNLQHTLPQAGNVQAVDKNLQHILQQVKSAQGIDKNLQHTLPQIENTQSGNKKLQHILPQTGSTQAGNKEVIDKNIQQILAQDTNVDGSDAIASLQETPSTLLTVNKQKTELPLDEKQIQQRGRASSQNSTQHVSPELLAEAANQKGKTSTVNEQQNTERFNVNTQAAQQNKHTEQQLAAQQNNKTVNGSEQGSDGIKASQAAIAAIQQRSGQGQASQPTNTVGTANNANAISAAAAESNSASSQQDFNSNQRDADMSLLDSAKADNKNAKGLDFQAQLAYKSQRTFTPADTMLEIVKSAKTGNTTLELQLEPANLGKVQVSIQIDQAKHIQVVFTVDQAASKQALEQQMPQLRLAMAQQGLDLGGFSMQMNQQGGQQQGGNQQASNRGTTDNALDATTLTHSNDEQNTRMGVNLATHGHLSILA